jgi:hypothetical protein
MKKLKLDTSTLLKLSLAKLKTTSERFTADCERHIGLSQAKYIATHRKTFKKISPSGEPYYRDELLYETANYFIKTTASGKILDIESKPKSMLKPQVVVKKKRTFQRAK